MSHIKFTNACNRAILKIVGIVALTISAFSVLAESTISTDIKVVTEYLEPYQVKNSDGSLGGYSTEVIHALFKELNITADIHVMPWARAYEVAKQQKNVLIYSIAHTPARDEIFQWIGSLTEERLYFWGLKTKFEQTIDDIEQLKDYKVAASRYSNVAQYLIDNKFYNIYQLIKEDQNMLMLYNNRVDLIVATELTVRQRAQKLGLNFEDMLKIKEVQELNNDLSIALSLKTAPEIVTVFQTAYQQLLKKGIIDQVKVDLKYLEA